MTVEYKEDADIHTKLNFMARAYTLLHNEIIRRRLPQDDYILSQICSLLQEINKIAHQFSRETKERETFKMPDEFVELIGTMKFIAKHVYEIEERLKKLEKGEFEHKIKISLDTTDVDHFNEKGKVFDPYESLLSFLDEIPRKIICWRFGIYGESKTLVECGKMFGFSSSRARQYQERSLRRLRRAVYENRLLIEKIPKGEFRNKLCDL